MTPRLAWLPWAPHLLALAVLLALALNTNLGRPWRGITPSDDDALAVAVVFLVGSIPWYTAFLLVLRHPALALVGAAPAARAAAAGIATAALVAALGLTRRGGGLIAFNLQDLLVVLPGVTAVALADGLDVRGLLPDEGRVDPRGWEGRNVPGERRRVAAASLLPDGRVVLQVRVSWDRGIFGDGEAEALVALRPDGALDDRSGVAALPEEDAPAAEDAGGRLVPSESGVMVNAPPPSGGPPDDPASRIEALLRRERADGSRDPAFRFRLPPDLARGLGRTRLELRHLLRAGGRTVVLLHARDEALAVVGRDGAVRAGEWLWIRIEPGEGFVADVAPLDDGRVALVFAERHHQTRVAIVTPGRAGELPWLELPEEPPATPRAAGDELVVPGEVLAVTGRGEVIVRGPEGLRILDAATGAERGFRPPPWLETP